MVQIKEIVRAEKFERELRRIRDGLFRERVFKLVEKVADDPLVGKPLKFGLKGEWTVRLPPYRLIYAVQGEKLILLRLEHRISVYG